LALFFFKAENFRLFKSIELNLHPKNNLLYGENASGKTSVLEAIAYLGRGRSFRNTTPTGIVRRGAENFLVFGKTNTQHNETTIGVINGRNGFESSVNGDHERGLGGLAKALPLQVIDPNIHKLIDGTPEERRRFIDWAVFHVEPQYLKEWRAYKRALKQRNAILKNNPASKELENWNKSLSERGESVNTMRRNVFEVLEPIISEISTDFLGDYIKFNYEPGWPEGESLYNCLQRNQNRDIQLKSTQIGPHRANISISCNSGLAKAQISRGQQKLLSCAMVLASIELVQTHTERSLLLLLDDPTAELDARSTKKLMRQIISTDAQIIATSIAPNKQLFQDDVHLFQVKHGKLKKTN